MQQVDYKYFSMCGVKKRMFVFIQNRSRFYFIIYFGGQDPKCNLINQMYNEAELKNRFPEIKL